MLHPKRIDALEIRTAGDEVIVHDARHDKVHVLNRSAGFVLELCDGSRPVAEIARMLSVWARIDIARAQRDVECVLQSFAGTQLIDA